MGLTYSKASFPMANRVGSSFFWPPFLEAEPQKKQEGGRGRRDINKRWRREKKAKPRSFVT
jgi:hypothetical protein